MTYSKDIYSLIRRELKKYYPASEGWRFSIIRNNKYTVTLYILQAPIIFTENDYYTFTLVDIRCNEHLSRMYSIVKGEFIEPNNTDLRWYVFICNGKTHYGKYTPFKLYGSIEDKFKML
jgi:hypothetical protein